MSEFAISAASLTIDPEESSGQEVVVSGRRFLAHSPVTLSFGDQRSGTGFDIQLMTDGTGSFGLSGEPQWASAVLMSTGTNVSEDDEVTVGEVTYVFKDDPEEDSTEVQIGDYAADSLLNLATAINDDGYIEVTDVTYISISLSPRIISGALGNDIATTTTSDELSFDSATMQGGVDVGTTKLTFSPKSGRWSISASDGVNRISATLRVWESA